MKLSTVLALLVSVVSPNVLVAQTNAAVTPF